MNKDEAVQKLSKVARISEANAEDLYDSFFEKPVVPQYVADWYEANKRNLNLNLCGFVFDRAINSTNFYREDFTEWVNDNKETFITTLVIMHQFGYEVEKETKYMVRFNNFKPLSTYLKKDLSDQRYYLGDNLAGPSIMSTYTRKELEDAGFGWVFDCPGVEVKEVTDGND